MKTIEDFCKEHDACSDGAKWAIENCKNMQEAWETAKPEWVVWIATRKGVLTNKELRLFAVFCARQNQHLLTDKRSLSAIDVAERFAHGEATQEELAAAEAAAAAWAEAWDAAKASAAAEAEAWAAAESAAEAALAARAKAWAAAAAAAAWAAARAAQINWLRENTQPNFGE